MDKKKYMFFTKQAEIIKAIGHPYRIAIIDFLKEGEQCVCDIAEHIGAERSNVSRHLAVMLAAEVVQCRKDGLKVMYELKTPCILGFFDCIKNCLRARANENAELLESL